LKKIEKKFEKSEKKPDFRRFGGTREGVRPPCPGAGFVLQRGRERRGGGFDGGAEFREHGEDAAEHGGGEDDGKERSFAHGSGFLSNGSEVFLFFVFNNWTLGDAVFLAGNGKKSAKSF
jgi:hypothetical protein